MNEKREDYKKAHNRWIKWTSGTEKREKESNNEKNKQHKVLIDILYIVVKYFIQEEEIE